MDWIKTDQSEFKGSLYFEEINKYEYKFPKKER